LSYSHFVEPVWLKTNAIELPFAGLDPRLDGLSVLHLTDFHLCRRVPASHIRQAVETGRRQQCSLVALTGDFVHAGCRQIAQLLSRLNAPLGVYAVLGNHDYSVRNPRGARRVPKLPGMVTDALTDAGVRVLHNEHVILEHNGTKLAVAGVADAWSKEADLPKALGGIDPQVVRICLAHNPSVIQDLGNTRCDLMLSGHTHGGQIHLPKLGRPLLSRRMREYAGGLIPHPTGYLYVNHGIGYTVRWRYQVRPEIAVLRFRRAKLETL
jgi:hypothetical protein